MFRSQCIFFACIVALVAGCRSGAPKDFPEEKKLADVPATQFVPALEERVKKGSNVIYTDGFLLAWNELRRQTGPVSTSVPQLKVLDQSDAYEDSLAGSKDVKLENGKVTIGISFEQSPAYAYPMEPVKLSFMGKAVRAFGYAHGIVAGVKMLYYKNEDEFVISIETAEKEQEIILAKGFANGRSLRVMLNNIQVATRIGSKNTLDASAVLMIPVLRFNLSTNYPAMENSFITANDQRYQIQKAAQRTAFLLNEQGAKAEGATTSSSAGAVQPKQLLFDKPFVVLLKKRTAKYPYFMMKVDNTALMMPLN